MPFGELCLELGVRCYGNGGIKGTWVINWRDSNSFKGCVKYCKS